MYCLLKNTLQVLIPSICRSRHGCPRNFLIKSAAIKIPALKVSSELNKYIHDFVFTVFMEKKILEITKKKKRFSNVSN